MRPGFRYHIATITALFVAIGLGIVLGSSLVKGAVDERIARRLDSLSKQFDNELQARRQDSDRQARFNTSIMPWLVKGRLDGKRICLVQTGDYPDTAARARDILESAGAVVSSVTVIDRSFPTRSKTNLKTILPKLILSHPELPSNESALLRVIATVLSKGGERDLQPMEGEQLVRLSGNYATKNDIAILIGGASAENESRVEQLDIPLISYCREKGMTMVLIEPEAAEVSYISAIRGEDISSVDNADTEIGRIALVLTLTGERGHFGVKPTASSGVLPAPLQSDDLRRRPSP